MKFSYNWLKEFLPSLPPPKETAHLLTMHALEVERVERDGGGWIFDIDLLPNRMSDAAAHLGIAREIAAILAMKRRAEKPTGLRMPDARVVERGGAAAERLTVRIEDSVGCPFYAARVIEGIGVRPSPPWLQKRLRTLGLEPINNVVDAANYVMLETGQPVHAFDLSKIAGEQGGKAVSRRNARSPASSFVRLITVRRARRGERITTLDGERRILDPSMVVIADAERALAIAGIKGGAAAAISGKTKAVALEAALFDAQIIYRTARALRLHTDASRRFEAGRAPDGVVFALNRLAALISELAGGSVAAGVIAVGKEESPFRSIPFSPLRAQELLGMAVDERSARRALEAVGCVVRASKRVRERESERARRREAKSRSLAPSPPRSSFWIVTPPPERRDLEREEDLVEEVGRLIGLEAIPREFPHAVLVPASAPFAHQWADRGRDVFVANGFSETMRMSFVNANLLARFGFPESPAVELENPRSVEAALLRPTLLPRLLLQLEEGTRIGADAALFEVGKAFSPDRRGGVEEDLRLAAVVAKEAKAESPPRTLKRERASVFYELKGAVQDLCDRFGLTDSRWVPIGRAAAGPWHSGKAADLVIGGSSVGIVGEIRVNVFPPSLRIGAVAAAELDLGALAAAATEEHEYRQPSRFPEALRDIAVLVPHETLSDDVAQEIAAVGKALVRDVDLFDYYEGEEIPDGMKNLAFRIAYQSDEKTLTQQEVDRLHRMIETALRKRGWEVR